MLLILSNDVITDQLDECIHEGHGSNRQEVGGERELNLGFDVSRVDRAHQLIGQHLLCAGR